ncbi:unnamed protein product [Rotaria sp. Silwood2]|nr:unnamed protein product [Rotaria sp. Silwood2]CAF3025728.1 unnamed protein product [Rotaria sp. Silwood2]CAF3170180.1 unnamed protein product [Rotaria sp. Silwood2]CAF3375540.1 unnamed protein product [Rotaria sp. Silwood2]CAF3903037.1 unnamed protein product [Rotaria sp. Silwood2]
MTQYGRFQLCRTSIDMKCCQQTPVLFDYYVKHRFVNVYESRLNCPVTCGVKKIIYVLTCLCGQFGHISETSYALTIHLDDHGHIFDSNVNVSIKHGLWCANSIHRPVSSMRQQR